jgi:hypothetical protein
VLLVRSAASSRHGRGYPLAGALLVLDVVVDRIGAIMATGVPLAVFVGLWVGLPLQLRRT